MTEPLAVWYRNKLVGTLSPTDSQLMNFAYVAEWSAGELSFPISVSLPLDGSFSLTASHRFFANLLPEGNVRQQICRALGVHPENDFAILKAIGGDCAGALTITSESEVKGGTETSNERAYEEISDDQLAAWSVGSPDAFAAVTGRNEVRLSLAGAQDKLPVAVQGGKLLLPLRHSPSTHLLKFGSRFYSHLPENEVYVTMLARAIGLPAVESVLQKTGQASIALVKRYDRSCVDGVWERLHQEDFCQALGISPVAKYQQEGGPSLRQCSDLLRRHSAFPVVDLQRLLRWCLFNLLVGNADAHGKNISLLYEDDQSLRLAPFYDLVCTRNYENISRHLAMSIGGQTDPGQVAARHLQSLGADLSIQAKMVIRTAVDLCDQLCEALPGTAQDFESRYGASPVLERIPRIVTKQIRRLRQQL